MPIVGCDDPGLMPLLQLETIGVDRYRAPHLARNMAGRIFGGQLLGSAMAAAVTSGSGLRPHMLQAFFLRAGSAERPLAIDVERSKDGRRFAHRRVSLRQADKLLLTAEISFHDDEAGLDEQTVTMPSVPPPEALADLFELSERYRDRLPAQTCARMRARPSMQIRPCDPEAGFIRPTDEARLRMWIKPAGALSAAPTMQHAALAFMSDSWLVAPTTSRHMRSFFDGIYAPASLNHSLWIHRVPDLGDWLLFETESPIVRGGRGLGRGFLYARSGELIATATQECLVQQRD